MISIIFHSLIWTVFFILARYSFAPRISISAYPLLWRHIFLTLLISDNSRYQTCRRNIYLLIPKHLIIQLAKLPIDRFNLNTTFDIAIKIPFTFEQVYKYVCRHRQCGSVGCLLNGHHYMWALVNQCVRYCGWPDTYWTDDKPKGNFQFCWTPGSPYMFMLKFRPYETFSYPLFKSQHWFN